MIVLAIDTATHSCAVCLYDANEHRVLAEQVSDAGHGHAEHLLGAIDQVLAGANRSFDDIGKIAVCIGPGSFTGIRVGVATARSLGLALEKSVVGVSTLEAIAADSALGAPFVVAIMAGRGQAYVQGFDGECVAQDRPYIVKLDDNPRLQIAQNYSHLVGNAAPLIDASNADASSDGATGSISRIAKLGLTSKARPSPLYVRAADAKPAVGFALPRQSETIK